MINDSFLKPTLKSTRTIKNFSSNCIATLEELFPEINTKGIPILKLDDHDNFSNQRGVSGSVGMADDRDFISLLYEDYFNLELQKVFERFRNQIVVDIGAGSSGYGLRLAEIAGAKAVVAVEPFFSHLLLKNIQNPIGPAKPYPQTARIPIVIVPENALSFLKRLPNNSVSILAGGIEKNIIQDPEYRIQLGEEVVRVLSPTGVLVDYFSELETYGLTELHNIDLLGLQEKIKH